MTQTPAIFGFHAEPKDYFLSNFFIHPFTLLASDTGPDSPVLHLAGTTAPTSEHFFQAAKTLDLNDAVAILVAPTAGQSKKLGRQVALRPDWEDVKLEVMQTILRAKFTGLEMSSQLLATGDAELIEANHWHDQIWGVCTCAAHQDLGENHLGRILMELRADVTLLAALATGCALR
jgi:ribA/ribD-fused uncharacterized protein